MTGRWMILGALLAGCATADLPEHDCGDAVELEDLADLADLGETVPDEPEDAWEGYEAPPLPYLGVYEGPIALFREVEGDLVEFCQGAATVFVGELGAVEGFGGCDGPSPGSHVEIGVDGRLDLSGRLQSTFVELWLEFDPLQSPAFYVDGGFPQQEQRMELAWAGSYELPGEGALEFLGSGMLFER